MEERSRSPREFRLVVAAGIGLVLLTGVGAYWIKANAERPQPTLEMAIGDGTLPIAYGFEANNAVAQLLQSLPPDLALDVCANLSGAVARTAQRPCDELREITAIAPAAWSGLAESAMAAMPGGTLTTPAAPEAAPTPTATQESVPQPSPIQDPAPQSQPPTAVMATEATAPPTDADPPAATAPSGVVASGAQIASAQTTEEPAVVAVAEDRDSEAKLLLALDEPATPAATTIADGTMALWLSSADLSVLEASDAADLDDGLTAEADAKLAAAAAAAKAQAKAKAKAAAAAKAKAKAKAKAARSADTASASAGRGKDRDNGAGGSGGDGGDGGDSDGGHQ